MLKLMVKMTAYSLDYQPFNVVHNCFWLTHSDHCFISTDPEKFSKSLFFWCFRECRNENLA